MLAVRDDRDRAAFARLYGHFAPRLKAFAMKGGTAADAAEDLVQDVMTTVWRKAHLFDPARAGVSTWIYAVTRNRRIDLARRARHPEPEELPWGPEPDAAPEEAVTLQQEGERLSRALAELPQAQRDLIARAYWGEASQSEIAAATGLPLGTIKSRIRLGLERLRRRMADRPDGPGTTKMTDHADR
ncbi:MAG: sigma-70 family RNA polymerase sigma factor [Paracoccaceae bacterium]